MPGIHLELSLTGDPVVRTLWRMADSLDDLTPLMDEIGRALVNSAQERIARTNTTPSGYSWPQSHRAIEEGGPTLYESGALADGINSRAAPDHVVVGTNTPYAAVMQFGAAKGAFGAAIGRTRPSDGRASSQDYFTPLPWGDIPERPYLGISAEDEDGIFGLARGFFADVANGLAG